MEKTKINKWNILLLFGITVIVLYFTLKDDFFAVVKSLKEVNVLWIIMACIFVFLYWFFQALAFNNIAKNFKKDMKLKQSLKINIITQFFNGITPFSTGGQPSQVYYLKKEGIPIPVGTSICMQNFLVYQITLIVLGILAFIFNGCFYFFEQISLIRTLVILGFIINSFVLGLIFLVSFNKKANKFLMTTVVNLLAKLKIIKKKEEVKEKWNKYLETFSESGKQMFKRPLNFLLLVFYNLIAMVILYIVPLTLIYSMNDFNSVSFIEAFTATAYVMIIGSFIPIPGAAGGIEYGFVSFYGTFLTGTSLSTLLLLWRFVTYYLGLFLGAIVINFYKDKKVKQ